MKKILLKNVDYIKSFGQDYYFSVLKIVDGIIGNSSSGLIEMPIFKKFTINIGNRQKGRFIEQSVINCKNKISNIQKSLKKAFSKNFKKKLRQLKLKNQQTSKIIIKSLKVLIIKKLDTKNLMI